MTGLMRSGSKRVNPTSVRDARLCLLSEGSVDAGFESADAAARRSYRRNRIRAVLARTGLVVDCSAPDAPARVFSFSPDHAWLGDPGVPYARTRIGIRVVAIASGDRMAPLVSSSAPMDSGDERSICESRGRGQRRRYRVKLGCGLQASTLAWQPTTIDGLGGAMSCTKFGPRRYRDTFPAAPLTYSPPDKGTGSGSCSTASISLDSRRVRMR